LWLSTGARTQGTSPPALTQEIQQPYRGTARHDESVTQATLAATWDDNAIYYLITSAGTGRLPAHPTDENQVFWMAYTLTNATVFTSGSPLTGTAFTTSGTTINNTVANVWPAPGLRSTLPGFRQFNSHYHGSPAGVTVLPNVASTMETPTRTWVLCPIALQAASNLLQR